MDGQSFSLRDILRNGMDRSEPLPAIVLLLERANHFILLPDEDFKLAAGDQLLLASPLSTRHNLEFSLKNANELAYVLRGEENSGGWLWQKLRRS